MNEMNDVISDEEAIKRFEESLNEKNEAEINEFLLETADDIHLFLSCDTKEERTFLKRKKSLCEKLLSNENIFILFLKSSMESSDALDAAIEIIAGCSEKIQSKFIEYILSDDEFFIKIESGLSSDFSDGSMDDILVNSNFKAFLDILKQFPDSRSEIIEKTLSNQNVADDFFGMDNIESALYYVTKVMGYCKSPQFGLNFLEGILNSSALHNLVESGWHDELINLHHNIQKIIAEEMLFSDKIVCHGMFANTVEARLAARERTPNSACSSGLPFIKLPKPDDLLPQEEMTPPMGSSDYAPNGFRFRL